MAVYITVLEQNMSYSTFGKPCNQNYFKPLKSFTLSYLSGIILLISYRSKINFR